MANPFSKGWKYLMSSMDQKIDENADPIVQINQAADAAKQQHQDISQQASAIIGNRNQLEMKLHRLVEEQNNLQEKAKTSLQLADAADTPEKAKDLQEAAEIYATQLVSVETQIEETKALHAQAVKAAEDATNQVKQSETRLQEQLAQIDELRTQVNQTKMQEASTATVESMQAPMVDDSVPSLDQVRAKIERRYADALGAQELMQNTMGDRLAEVDAAGTDTRAAARLEEIRAQMLGSGSSSDAAGELETGADASGTEDAPSDGARDEGAEDKE